MCTREANALDAGDSRHRLKEPRERLDVSTRARRVLLVPRRVAHAVPEHALPQEAHFLDAAFRERGDFGDDFARGAGVFVAADVWHDAVAAAVVASKEDSDERLPSAFDMRGEAVRHEVFAKLYPRKAPFLDDARNEPERAWADGEVKFREALEDISAHSLDGTAHEPRELLRSD